MMLSKLTSVFGENFEKFVRFIRGDNKSRDKRFTDSDQEWVLPNRRYSCPHTPNLKFGLQATAKKRICGRRNG